MGNGGAVHGEAFFKQWSATGDDIGPGDEVRGVGVRDVRRHGFNEQTRIEFVKFASGLFRRANAPGRHAT